jgi:hypothetical protein
VVEGVDPLLFPVLVSWRFRNPVTTDMGAEEGDDRDDKRDETDEEEDLCEKKR